MSATWHDDRADSAPPRVTTAVPVLTRIVTRRRGLQLATPAPGAARPAPGGIWR